MTSRDSASGHWSTRGAPGTLRPARFDDSSDLREVLDHFVSGFEWMVPSQIQILESEGLGESGEPTDNNLLWFSIGYEQRRVHAGPGMLENFLMLESARDEQILAYARRWGPLWLCAPHNLPYRHNPDCEPSRSDFEPAPDLEALGLADQDLTELSDDEYLKVDELISRDYHTWYDEYLSAWRELARQMRATVRIARRLHDGQPGHSNDWKKLRFLRGVISRVVIPAYAGPLSGEHEYPDTEDLERRCNLSYTDFVRSAEPPDDRPRLLGTSGDDDTQDEDQSLFGRFIQFIGQQQLATSLDFQRQVLSEVLNYWLKLASVRPRLEWTGDKAEIQLGGDGLAGALTVQLVFECSRTDGLAVCTSCGTPFLPGARRPRRDRNTYCSDCGLKAAARDASARYRQTQKYKTTYRRWLRERKRR